MSGKKEVDVLMALRVQVAKDAKGIVELIDKNLKPGVNRADIETDIFAYLCEKAVPRESEELTKLLRSLDRVSEA